MGEAGYLLFMRASAAKRPNVWVSLLSADAAGRRSARSWRWRYRYEQRTDSGFCLQPAAILFWLRAVPFQVPSDRELILRGRVECWWSNVMAWLIFHSSIIYLRMARHLLSSPLSTAHQRGAGGSLWKWSPHCQPLQIRCEIHTPSAAIIINLTSH